MGLVASVWPVEREIATARVEIGIGFDAHGRERWRVPGDVEGFDPTVAQGHMIRGGIMTHNHVGGDHCITPSVGDVQFGAYYRLAEVRAVGIENNIVTVGIVYAPRNITEEEWNAAFDANRWRVWCDTIAYAWQQLGIRFERVSS